MPKPLLDHRQGGARSARRILWSIVFFFPTTVFADTPLVNPLKDTKGELKTIPEVIGGIVGSFPPVIGAAAFLFIIIGGFMMISAGGNEEKIEKGKSILIWTAVGIGVLLMAFILIKFVIVKMTNEL